MNIRKNEEPVFSDNGTYSRLLTSECSRELNSCTSTAETTNESADEGPIETLENPNTLEDAINLQVQENLRKLRKFYGIDCIRNDRRISIRQGVFKVPQGSTGYLIG